MSTTPKADETQDGTAEQAAETPHALSRRAMLGGGASGFALAAGGLLAPTWLVEAAEADDHPVRRVQNRKDGQRAQRRHRLAHRREVNRRQREKNANRDKPGSGLSDPGIEFRVELTGSRHIKVDFYTNAGYDRDYWAFTDRETLAEPGHGIPTYTFTTRDRAGALWIDDRYLIKAIKVHFSRPRLTMGLNGEFIDRTQDGWRNGSIEFDGYPREGAGVQPMRVNGYAIQPTLLQETDKRIVYKVTIAAPAA